MQSPPPRQALGWLERQPEFRALTDRAARLLALQADLQRCAPARGLTALGIDDGTLLVGTVGAAAAAKLRQIEPTIVAHLALLGWPVRRIRFRPMAVGSVAPLPPAQVKTPIPASALSEFETLSEAASSPALKEALRHLVDARRRGRGNRD